MKSNCLRFRWCRTLPVLISLALFMLVWTVNGDNAPEVLHDFKDSVSFKSQETSEAQPNATGPIISYVPGSTVKLEQLLGDLDKEPHKPTVSQTVTVSVFKAQTSAIPSSTMGERISCSATPLAVSIRLSTL